MSFLYPYFLLLSLFVIVPIAIHLFNFHRYKKVIFTNVAMLKNLVSINKKQNTKHYSKIKHVTNKTKNIKIGNSKK